MEEHAEVNLEANAEEDVRPSTTNPSSPNPMEEKLFDEESQKETKYKQSSSIGNERPSPKSNVEDEKNFPSSPHST